MSLKIKTHQSAYNNNFMAFIYILGQIFLICLPVLALSYFAPGKGILYFLYCSLAMLFIGTRMRALGNIIHECSHFSFVPEKKWNSFIGHMLSVFELSSFTQYKKNHEAHHKYLGIKGKDNDYEMYLILIRPYQRKRIFNNFSILFVLIVFNPSNWFFYLFKNISLFEKNKNIFYFKIGYILFILLLTFISYKVMLFLLIPYITSYQMMRILSDFLDHHKVYFEKNYFFKSRNHIFRNSLLNIIFFPRNDSYHLVHHLYPRAPTIDFNEIHQQLLINNNKYKVHKHYLF